MEGFNKILYPIELTDMSTYVAPYVVTMAKRFDAEVHLLADYPQIYHNHL